MNNKNKKKVKDTVQEQYLNNKEHVRYIYIHVVVPVSGILTPTDEFQYWADLAASSAKGEDRERARFFSDAFQKQIAPQFAALSTLSMADVAELVEETQDVLDEIWKQTDFDKAFPEARMKRLLDVIGEQSSDSFHLPLLIALVIIWHILENSCANGTVLL